MFLAIDRVSKFTYVEFHERANTVIAAAFLRNVIKVFSYKIRIVLTDNGIQFADRRETASVTPHDGGFTSSIASAMSTGSSIGLPSPTIPERTVRPSG